MLVSKGPFRDDLWIDRHDQHYPRMSAYEIVVQSSSRRLTALRHHLLRANIKA